MKKWSFLYFLIFLLVCPMHWLFYKRIVVKGLKNVPKKQPLIFTPNHQNALMDPLAVLFTRLWQIVFLARADIFKKKTIASLLYTIKILPVYRERDGKDSLDKNDEIFNLCIDILEQKRWLGLFPEAAHTDKRSLRSLRKGVPRIAFLAENRNNFKLGLKIVPIGIYYSNYTRFRSSLMLQYGNPINVSDYQDLYLNNEPKALNALKDKIAEELIPLMIHIKNLDYYDVYETIRLMLTSKMLQLKGLSKGMYNEFVVQKQIIANLDKQCELDSEFMPALAQKVREYNQCLNALKIEDSVVEKYNDNWMFLLLKVIFLISLSPIFVFGYIVNILPYSISGSFVKRKIKDLQFHSSIRFGFSLILFPLFYLLQSILLEILLETNGIMLLLFLIFAISGIAAFHLKQSFKFVVKQVHFKIQVKRNNLKFCYLLLKRNEIANAFFKIN